MQAWRCTGVTRNTPPHTPYPRIRHPTFAEAGTPGGGVGFLEGEAAVPAPWPDPPSEAVCVAVCGNQIGVRLREPQKNRTKKHQTPQNAQEYARQLQSAAVDKWAVAVFLTASQEISKSLLYTHMQEARVSPIGEGTCLDT